MRQQPITNYLPVVDTLHWNLIKDIPTDSLFFTTHTPPELLTITIGNAKDSYHSDGFTLKRIHQHNNRYFRLQYRVEYNTRALGDLYLDRYKEHPNQAAQIPFHFANAALYTDWIPVFGQFLAAFEVKPTAHPSKLDIALDSNCNTVSKWQRMYNSNKVQLRSSTKVLEVHDCEPGSKGEPTVYVGSSKSAVQSVLYNKTISIEQTGKQYITDYHKANGLDISRPIYRTELKTQADAFANYKSIYVNEDGELISEYKYKLLHPEQMESTTFERITNINNTGVDYTKLTDGNYLVSLYSLFTNIDFCDKAKRTKKHCNAVPFFNFDKYQKEIIMTISRQTIATRHTLRIQKQALEAQVFLFKRNRNPVFMEAAAAAAAEYDMRTQLAAIIKAYNVAELVAEHFPRGLFQVTAPVDAYELVAV